MQGSVGKDVVSFHNLTWMLTSVLAKIVVNILVMYYLVCVLQDLS